MGNSNAEQLQAQSIKAWELRQAGKSFREIADELGCAVGWAFRLTGKARAALYDTLADELLDEKKRATAALDLVIEEAIQEWERSRDNIESDRTVVKETAVDADGKRVSLTASEASEITDILKGFDPESAPGLFDAEDSAERAQIVANHTADHLQKRLRDLRKEKDGSIAARITETARTQTTEGRLGDPRYLKLIVEAEAAKRAIWGIDAPKKQDVTSNGKTIGVIGYEIVPPRPRDTE
jgi:hypothetical protein